MAADGEAEIMGLIRKAMAFRVKFRLEGGKKMVPLGLLGVHPMNRRGLFPNGERVKSLGLDILKDGFSIDEAQREGVCVEEAPREQQKRLPRSGGEGVRDVPQL